jgi:hypothetical protein
VYYSVLTYKSSTLPQPFIIKYKVLPYPLVWYFHYSIELIEVFLIYLLVSVSVCITIKKHTIMFSFLLFSCQSSICEEGTGCNTEGERGAN